MYVVYILKTSKNTLYTGITNDLSRRVSEHTSKSKRGAKYTRSFATLELVFTENASSREEALRREWQIKKMSRKQKDALISTSDTP